MHPYGYTDLLDISKIIEKNWEVISKKLPKEAVQNRKVLLEGFTQLNRLRRMVMHPVRGGTPTEADFTFLREFKAKFGFVEQRPAPNSIPPAKTNDDLDQLVKELQRIAGQGQGKLA